MNKMLHFDKQKNPTITLPFLLILLLIFSCGASKNNITGQTLVESTPKLIFLNYSISKKSNGKKNIQFIKKIITDGKLKNNTDTYLKTAAVGDLECLQLNKDSKKIVSVILKNPLSKHIEFVNDSLIFENKKVELNKALFSLRLQLHSQTKFIAINEITDSLQNTGTLVITKID